MIKSNSKKALSLILSLAIGISGITSTPSMLAASKPSVAKSATVTVGKTEKISINANGTAVKKVKVKVYNKKYLSATATTSSIKITERKKGSTTLKTRVWIIKSKHVKKYTFYTHVTIQKEKKVTPTPSPSFTPDPSDTPNPSEEPTTEPTAVPDEIPNPGNGTLSFVHEKNKYRNTDIIENDYSDEQLQELEAFELFQTFKSSDGLDICFRIKNNSSLNVLIPYIRLIYYNNNNIVYEARPQAQKYVSAGVDFIFQHGAPKVQFDRYEIVLSTLPSDRTHLDASYIASQGTAPEGEEMNYQKPIFKNISDNYIDQVDIQMIVRTKGKITRVYEEIYYGIPSGEEATANIAFDPNNKNEKVEFVVISAIGENPNELTNQVNPNGPAIQYGNEVDETCKTLEGVSQNKYGKTTFIKYRNFGANALDFEGYYYIYKNGSFIRRVRLDETSMYVHIIMNNEYGVASIKETHDFDRIILCVTNIEINPEIFATPGISAKAKISSDKKTCSVTFANKGEVTIQGIGYQIILKDSNGDIVGFFSGDFNKKMEVSDKKTQDVQISWFKSKPSTANLNIIKSADVYLAYSSATEISEA